MQKPTFQNIQTKQWVQRQGKYFQVGDLVIIDNNPYPFTIRTKVGFGGKHLTLFNGT